MRQALEMALDWIKKQPEETPHSKYDVDTRYVVIRELEAALAQQRTWVELTDEELSILGESFTHPDEGINEVDFGMEIQRILKEKNT
jgi:hypothetical protein